MNKKGAEMTIGTIVIIVLALVVLVVLIIGFTRGWDSFMDIFNGGGENVDSVVRNCAQACLTTGTHSYCESIKTLKFKIGDKKHTVKLTCNQLENGGSLPNTKGDTVALPSTELSCSEVDCPTPEEKDCSKLSRDDCKDGCKWVPDPAAGAAPDAGTCVETTTP